MIVGPDLVVRNGQVITRVEEQAGDDCTLMTRGMKGCWVYFTDEETREYFQKAIDINTDLNL